MFSLPSIPTDNLYKFCFVSGVILLVLVAFISYNTTMLELKKESSKEKDQVEGFRDSVLKAEFNDRRTNSQKNADKLTIQQARIQYTQRTDSIINKYILGYKDNSIIIAYLQYNIMIIVLGVIFVLFGGLRWYYAVQKPQDLLLKIQLDMADVELKVANIKLRTLESQQALKSLDQVESITGPSDGNGLIV